MSISTMSSGSQYCGRHLNLCASIRARAKAGLRALQKFRGPFSTPTDPTKNNKKNNKQTQKSKIVSVPEATLIDQLGVVAMETNKVVYR